MDGGYGLLGSKRRTFSSRACAGAVGVALDEFVVSGLMCLFHLFFLYSSLNSKFVIVEKKKDVRGTHIPALTSHEHGIWLKHYDGHNKKRYHNRLHSTNTRV